MRNRVLVLCIENTCRSQMAEGFLRHIAGEGVDVYSAGIRKGAEVNPLAVEVMKEIGIDISQQYPKKVQRFLREDFDYVITTCDQAQEACPYFPKKTKFVHWNIDDPAAVMGTKEERLRAYRAAREHISEEVQAFITTLQ